MSVSLVKEQYCWMCGWELRESDAGRGLVDEFGGKYCEQYYDECPACQDGESHPHEPVSGAPLG